MRALLARLRLFRAPEPPARPPAPWRGLHLSEEQRNEWREAARRRLVERQDPTHPEHIGRPR